MTVHEELNHIEHTPKSLEESFLMRSLVKLRAATGSDVKVLEVDDRRARVTYPDYLKPWLDNHAGEYGLSFPVGEDGSQEQDYLCIGQ